MKWVITNKQVNMSNGTCLSAPSFISKAVIWPRASKVGSPGGLPRASAHTLTDRAPGSSQWHLLRATSETSLNARPILHTYQEKIFIMVIS